MKKMISMLLCFVLVLGLDSVPVFGAGVGDLYASVDNNNRVTVGGTVSDGAGKLVSIKVLNPQGRTDYVNSCVSQAGGRFEFSYTLAGSSGGRYAVTISTAGLTNPVKTGFDYGGSTTGANLTANATMNASTKLVTVSGTISSGAGRLISVKIMGPDNKTEYSGVVMSMARGGFRLTYTLMNSTKGKYTVSVGAKGVTAPVTCYFGYGTYTDVQAFINMDKLITVSGSAGVPGAVVSARITDPKGKCEYLGSTAVRADGTYQFSYTLSNTAKGRYTVAIGTKELKTPVTAYFIYGGNLLESLIVSDTSLTPAFLPEIFSYSATAENSISSVKVTATAADTGASIRINDNSVSSGTPSGQITLNTGTNTINVVVTAGDGTAATYTITVTRSAPAVSGTPVTSDTPVVLSGNNNLSGLTASSGTLSPAFAAATTGYAISVGYDTDSITVTPTVAESHATVKVNGAAVAGGSASGAISLSVGANSIPIAVTARNGAVKTYTITVTRAAEPLSDNANLSGLTFSYGILSPSFIPATTSYALSVNYDTTSITVTPTVEEGHATVKVNGTDAASGSASGTISLSVGANQILIVVTARSGVTKTYTVTATRAVPDASLSSLSALWGIGGEPAGQTSLITYEQDVDVYELTQDNFNITGFYVYATASDPGATIDISAGGESYDSNKGVTLHQPSDEVIDDITVTIKVTAKDNITFETYTITVHPAGF